MNNKVEKEITQIPTVFIVRPDIFKGMTQDQAEQARMGIHPTLLEEFYGIGTFLPPSAWIVGTNLREIYEQGLGQQSMFGGPNADNYIDIEHVLALHGIVPILVEQDQFTQLTKIPEERQEAVIKKTFKLPL